MSDTRFKLREAVSVPDLKARDRLVRRLRKIRDGAVLERATIEHWNNTHAGEPPISTAFEDALIAWCDGKGPMPKATDADIPVSSRPPESPNHD